MEQKAFELIEQLSAKLGVASDYIMAALIRQAYVNAVIWIILDVIFLAASVLLIKNANKINNFFRDEDDDLTVEGVFVFLIFGGVYLFFAIACLANIPEILTGFFNPEYWAIEQILYLLKP